MSPLKSFILLGSPTDGAPSILNIAFEHRKKMRIRIDQSWRWRNGEGRPRSVEQSRWESARWSRCKERERKMLISRIIRKTSNISMKVRYFSSIIAEILVNFSCCDRLNSNDRRSGGCCWEASVCFDERMGISAQRFFLKKRLNWLFRNRMYLQLDAININLEWCRSCCFYVEEQAFCTEDDLNLCLK